MNCTFAVSGRLAMYHRIGHVFDVHARLRPYRAVRRAQPFGHRGRHVGGSVTDVDLRAGNAVGAAIQGTGPFRKTRFIACLVVAIGEPN